ncbi:uncharacterized protein LOC129906113 [Episyrphus balteatus]|uniref:uncharacterized protein LOC129906113 n=1 Tax=Episyrphus balteatus TaxID=286459 RepID=UPI0024851D65|nr:uncharacterized protein LOC129906113 [Episyrphus balteatus]
MPDNVDKVQEEVIGRVSIKVPPFWKRSPDLWLLQLEAQFHTSAITSDVTKYFNLFGNLEADVLTEVRDVVTSPPATEKYNGLKTRLLAAFQESEQKRLQTLLSGITLDGRRPTQLLSKMRELASSTISEDILRTLWMKQLPNTTQSILSCSANQELKTLAEIADKISDVYSNSDVASVSKPSSISEISELKNQIASLQKDIEQLKVSRSRSSSRSKNFIRNKSKSRNQKMCYYHRRFGKQARKCQEPCQFQTGN